MNSESPLFIFPIFGLWYFLQSTTISQPKISLYVVHIAGPFTEFELITADASGSNEGRVDVIEEIYLHDVVND